MKITWNELTVDTQDLDLNSLLSEWRWLVSEEYAPFLVSAIGDMFLCGPDDHVYRLDSASGRLADIARDREAFKQVLTTEDRVNEIFQPNLIGDLLTAGARLTPRQCFGYKVPPVLGGAIAADNMEPTDLVVHFNMLGQINSQIQNLPEGTQINGVKTTP